MKVADQWRWAVGGFRGCTKLLLELEKDSIPTPQAIIGMKMAVEELQGIIDRARPREASERAGSGGAEK